MGSLLGIVLLIIDIWAIIQIAGSRVTAGRKILWILLILLLPLIGIIIWYFTGPRK